MLADPHERDADLDRLFISMQAVSGFVTLFSGRFVRIRLFHVKRFLLTRMKKIFLVWSSRDLYQKSLFYGEFFCVNTVPIFILNWLKFPQVKCNFIISSHSRRWNNFMSSGCSYWTYSITLLRIYIVADLWHFGTDPYPRIRASDKWIWIRIWILLFSSLTFKMPTKNKFFLKSFSACYFLKLHVDYFSKLKRQKEVTKP